MQGRELGGFDPRLLGICAHANSQDEFTLLDKFIYGRFSQQEITTHRFTGHEIATLTTIAHETRHFHDFLLSPLGAASFRLSYITQYLTKELFVTWDELGLLNGATCLPVPITRWLNLDDAARTGYIEKLNGFLGANSKLKPPVFNAKAAKQINSVYSELSDYYQRIWEFWRPREVAQRTGISPVHLWELSAFLVQLNKAGMMFGHEGRGRFIEYIYSDPNNTYAMAIHVLREVLGARKDEVDFDCMAIMVTWALLGDDEDASDLSSPATRFFVLAKHIEKTGVPDWQNLDIFELYTEWDAVTQYPSAFEALHKSIAHDEGFIDKLSESSQPAADRLSIYLQSRKKSINCFLNAPLEYILPDRYLNEAVENLTQPPLILKINGASWWRDEDHYDYTSYVEVEGGIMASPLQAWSSGEIDIRFVEQLLTDCAVADVLFCDQRLLISEFDLAIAKKIFGKDIRFLLVPDSCGGCPG